MHGHLDRARDMDVADFAVCNGCLAGPQVLPAHLQTNKGTAQIDGIAGPAACGSASVNVPLLGVVAKTLDFNAGANFATAGENVAGMGYQVDSIQADVRGEPPPELPGPATPVQAIPVSDTGGLR
ncbi:MAG TPA: hypothetical protein PKK06_14725 [Phycisphaerae bacterium]|nr:hypothetical protein [Phycisphaerae bacterium]HNU46533.1 hypothetical protein [Phycisphaerae bacterium]